MFHSFQIHCPCSIPFHSFHSIPDQDLVIDLQIFLPSLPFFSIHSSGLTLSSGPQDRQHALPEFRQTRIRLLEGGGRCLTAAQAELQGQVGGDLRVLLAAKRALTNFLASAPVSANGLAKGSRASRPSAPPGVVNLLRLQDPLRQPLLPGISAPPGPISTMRSTREDVPSPGTAQQNR